MTWLRIGTDGDLQRLLDLRKESEEWLAEKGLSQYQDQDFALRAREDITNLLQDGRFVILTSNGQDLLACAALTGPDRDFWDDEDDLESAWYLSRIMTTEHGRDWGGRLLDLLALAAAQDGRTYLRLDCWRDNHLLHDYYRRHGFDLMRIEDRPHRLSGALLQRPARGMLPRPWDHTQ